MLILLSNQLSCAVVLRKKSLRSRGASHSVVSKSTPHSDGASDAVFQDVEKVWMKKLLSRPPPEVRPMGGPPGVGKFWPARAAFFPQCTSCLSHCEFWQTRGLDFDKWEADFPDTRMVRKGAKSWAQCQAEPGAPASVLKPRFSLSMGPDEGNEPLRQVAGVCWHLLAFAGLCWP